MLYTPLPKDPPKTIRRFIKQAGMLWISNSLLYLLAQLLSLLETTLRTSLGDEFVIRMQFSFRDLFEVNGVIYFSLFLLELIIALLEITFSILFFSIPVTIFFAIVIRVMERLVDRLPDNLL